MAIEILELLRRGLGVMYISDLKRIKHSDTMKEICRPIIRNIPTTDYSVSDWADVYNYLTGKKIEGSAEEIKNELMVEI